MNIVEKTTLSVTLEKSDIEQMILKALKTEMPEFLPKKFEWIGDEVIISGEKVGDLKEITQRRKNGNIDSSLWKNQGEPKGKGSLRKAIQKYLSEHSRFDSENLVKYLHEEGFLNQNNQKIKTLLYQPLYNQTHKKSGVRGNNIWKREDQEKKESAGKDRFLEEQVKNNAIVAKGIVNHPDFLKFSAHVHNKMTLSFKEKTNKFVIKNESGIELRKVTLEEVPPRVKLQDHLINVVNLHLPKELEVTLFNGRVHIPLGKLDLRKYMG